MNIKDTVKDILRPTYRSFLARVHRGSTYKCNICGSEFRDMKPVKIALSGGGFKISHDEPGSCWKCNSYARMRLLWHYFENDFGLENLAGKRILHVAPEYMISDKLRHLDNIEYTAIDMRTPGYKYAKFVIAGDIRDLKFEDNTFDVIICNHVLEHVKEDQQAMREILRVCKPGGFAILMIPIDISRADTDEESLDENLSPAERELRFEQSDHVRVYGRDYFDRLSNAGFDVERKSYNQEITNKLALLNHEEVIIGHKPGV